MKLESQGNSVSHSDVTGYDEESLKEKQALPFAGNWGRFKTGNHRLLRIKKTAAYLILFDLTFLGLLLVILWPLISLFLRNDELFRPSDVLSPGNGTIGYHSGDKLIPRILHQTCPNETIPENLAQAHQSCQKSYADFEYKLWTHERSRDFVASEYPWFLHDWDNYAFNIQRADAIRYFVLYHFGGVYFDMDTICGTAIPLDQVGSVDVPHTALFQVTIPTGVTNSFMVASAKHPAFAEAIHKLPKFHAITRFWARIFPYCNVMIATGSFYITLVLRGYLLNQTSLPSASIQTVNTTQLEPYITDLKAASWFRADASIMLWLEDKPLVWFGLGAIGFIAGLYALNRTALFVLRNVLRWVSPPTYSIKQFKLS